MTIILTSDQLTSETKNIKRTKYFPVEIYLTGCSPGVTYSVYFEGVDVSAFCKPYGGDLGDPIISDNTGKIIILFLLGIQYSQFYLTQSDISPDSNIVNSNKMIELRSPQGHSMITYLPFVLKA